jgi:hypothetical protein
MMRFTGFRYLCEADFEKSNMDGVLARDLNIVPHDNDTKMDMVSPGAAIQFKGKQLKALNKLLGIDGEDVAIKMIHVVRRNDYGVQIQDITGGCDNKGLNTGRDYGPFADQPFPHAPCSPTNGKVWWISAKDWDNIRMPLPPGSGQQGGGSLGGPGGGLGGGLGGGGPMPPTPGPAAPPPGGAAAPPPPA